MKIRTFFSLTIWALLLDLLGIIVSLLSFHLWFNKLYPVAFILSLTALVSFLKSIELLSTLPQRFKAWKKLVDTNKDTIVEDSFEKFFTAPCGRALARDALQEIGKKASYNSLKKKYYKGFFSKAPDNEIVFFRITNGRKEYDGTH